MWEAVIAALAGLASIFTQGKMNENNMLQSNKQTMDMTNQINQNQYDLYNSPTARADALRKAGLSDAAIGAALSGYSGQSGITLTSQPLQPTSVGSTISDLFSSLTGIGDLERKKGETKSNIALNEVQIKKLGIEAGLKGRELDLFNETFQNMVTKSLLENEVLASEYNLNEALRKNADADEQLKKIEFYVQSGTMDSRIEEINNKVKLQQSQLKLNDAQIKQITANIALLEAQADAINDLKDERERQSAEARFYKQFLDEHDIPYDVLDDIIKHGSEILSAILNVFNISSSSLTRLVKSMP